MTTLVIPCLVFSRYSHPDLPSFPTRRSSDLFRMRAMGTEVFPVESGSRTLRDAINEAMREWMSTVADHHREREIGRATRLNSSHPSISYAVFCLKKKKQTKHCELPLQYTT